MANTTNNATEIALCAYGAKLAKSIADDSVSFALGAAVFITENSRAAAPLPTQKRRAAYEGRADYGSETKAAYFLGVEVASQWEETIITLLQGLNDKSPGNLVAQLRAKLLEANKEEHAKAPEDVALVTNAKGKVVFARLDGWIRGRKPEKNTVKADALATMAKRLEKLVEETGAATAEDVARALDTFAVLVKSRAAQLRNKGKAAEVAQPSTAEVPFLGLSAEEAKRRDAEDAARAVMAAGAAAVAAEEAQEAA